MKIELSGHYTHRRLLLSSIPSMAMMIIGSLYSIVDGLFVSNYVGLTPFAGLNIAWPAIMVVGALGLMVGTGGSAIISIMLGQKNLEKACETFTSLLVFTILLAIGLGVPMYFLMPKIVVLLGAEGEELIYNATLYGRVFAIGMPAFMLQTAFQPFFMAAEKPELGTKLSLACGATNMILDALFIVVFKWGLAGAAIASILACCIGGFFP
ncbi:MAG TPA: MATE family efflux transporter, partial [Rikenellaceae bacterium]|nr:MATE family efflux transporter [Rikenellaceae bacterium]